MRSTVGHSNKPIPNNNVNVTVSNLRFKLTLPHNTLARILIQIKLHSVRSLPFIRKTLKRRVTHINRVEEKFLGSEKVIF